MKKYKNIYEGNLKFIKNNCDSYSELKEFNTVMLEASSAFANAINSKLLESFINKSNVDFDMIPESRGKFYTYAGYATLLQAIEILSQNKNTSGKTEYNDNVTVISETISNIVGLEDKFSLAFKIDNNVLTTMYCTLVMAVIQATSVEIAISIDDDGKLINKKIDSKKNKTVEILRNFNKSVRDTTIVSEINKILAESNKNFLGGMSSLAILASTAGVFLAVVPILRELIFLYYNSRMRISNLLDQQVYFIESNKSNVENSNMPIAKRKQIKAKQNAIINKLSQISDKIRVDHASAIKGAEHEMQAENKKWTLKKLDDNVVNSEMVIF